MTKKPKKEPSPNRKPWMLTKDVQPLRTQEEINTMKWAIKRYCGERDAIAFLIGINTGLRCGDIMRLQIEDVKGKKEIKITEGKTKKPRMIYFSGIYKELNAYIESLGRSAGPLFPSRKGGGSLTVVQFYRQLQKAAGWVELDAIGTHTMRKTFGFFHYKQFKDVATLQMIFNHSTPEVTLRYIGITEQSIKEGLMNFKL